MKLIDEINDSSEKSDIMDEKLARLTAKYEVLHEEYNNAKQLVNEVNFNERKLVDLKKCCDDQEQILLNILNKINEHKAFTSQMEHVDNLIIEYNKKEKDINNIIERRRLLFNEITLLELKSKKLKYLFVQMNCQIILLLNTIKSNMKFIQFMHKNLDLSMV